MLVRLVALCFGVVLWITTLRAAPALDEVEMLFRNWTTGDGLPHNRVRAVTRTRDGFIWLATDGGVVRFDGANFKVFGLREGLMAPIALALQEDDEGALWIGTLGGGLSVLRHGVIERTYTTADGLPSNWISGLGMEPGRGMVVATLSGITRFGNHGFSRPAKDNPAPLPVLSVVNDGGGVLWGVGWGQYLRTWKDGDWEPDASGGPAKATAICKDPDGRLWAVGDRLLWVHDASGWTSHQLPDGFTGQPNSVASAPDGTIWTAFHRSGLCGFRDGRFIVPSPGPEYVPDLVETITATDDGQMWITTANGLYRMAPRRIHVSTIDDPQSPRVANNLGGLIEHRPGEFIVATQGSGFYQWKDGRASRLSDEPNLGAGVYGNTILKTAGGSVWLGANRGLFEMKPDGSIRRQPVPGGDETPIWALTETPEGLWIGTGYGQLHLLKDGGLETIPYGGAKEPIKAIVREEDGTLWVGTRGNGLFQRKGGEWKRFGRGNGLVSEIIRTLYVDPAGRLWVGSDGGGLSLWLKDRFVSATTREGMPNDSVSQILMDDDGRLWAGTHRGLAVLDSEALDLIESGRLGDLHPLLINEADGIPAGEFTIVPPLKTTDGRYAFTTVNGFIRLRPADFHPDNSRPEVFIERITANGNPVTPDKERITLPPGTERLEFEFTGLFFSDPERLKFRNRLTNIESGWAYIGSRRATEYRNLEPGTYQFRVEASTGNGLWSATPATVNVVIEPHFWQTVWFKAASIVMAVGLVVLIAMQQERKRSRRRIEALERRQAVDSERARIARDLHDDVGASLTQMALQSQLVERNLTRQPDRAEAYLQDIFKTARTMTRALDEIIWAVNPSHDTLENFISFLGSFMQDYAETSGLRSRFDVPESIPQRVMPPTVRHHLYLAAKEVLHNVVKHAGATEVTLQVKLGGGYCVIIISDNGSGFEEPAETIGADGLINMRNRLEQIRGTCTRQSAPGRGTSVEMRVPMDWQDG